MDRPMLIIVLALFTLFAVIAWAMYTKKKAESGPHYFGKPDDETAPGGQPASERNGGQGG